MTYAAFTEEVLGKTLPELENFHPGPFPAGMEWSSVIQTMYEVYRTPLAKLTAEQIRMSLGQRTGYQYLIPLALDILVGNPLTYTKHYAGDLLSNVLRCPGQVWQSIPSLHEAAICIANQALQTLLTEQPYLTCHIASLRKQIADLAAARASAG